MTKYTIKLLLYTHQTNKKGMHPIYLKVYTGGKAAYKSTGHYVNEKMWDDKNEKVKESFSNSDFINAHIALMKSDWEKKLITNQIAGVDLTAPQIKEDVKPADHKDVFKYVDDLIISLNGKRSNKTLKNYRSHLMRLEKYNGSRTLSFDQINVTFLKNYEAWLRANVKFRKEDSQKNYLHAIWKTFKTWFNAAKLEGIINHYPFDKYENPVYVAPDKDYLSQGELKDFEKFTDECMDPVLKESAVYFLFGCYSGLRVSDWFKFSQDQNIKDGKLRLRPAKTKHKWVEMIISKPLKRNLLRMAGIKLKLAEPTINEKLKLIANKLKIGKHLTTHTGRHTFAVTICLGNKVSSETAAELMGITLDTFVKNYSQVTQSKIDSETAAAWKKLT